MNIVLVLLISINGISCLKGGRFVDSLSTYSNYVATVWQHDPTTPRYLCSGTIITPSHIITAGRCVHDVRNYEIYVTAGRIDLDQTLSVMVHNIYLHRNLKKVYNPSEPHMEYWLNDIAILNLVYKLNWDLHIQPVSWRIRGWTSPPKGECYIMGWNYIPTDTASLMTLRWSDALILGDGCSQPNAFLLSNEIHAILGTPNATLDDTDIGNSLICNKQAIGIIVGGRDPTRSLVTLLRLAPYKLFIQYIIAGGVMQIGQWDFRDVVSIWGSGHFRCGAFIVHDRHIVTAAHCVHGMDRANLSVASSYLDPPAINTASQQWSSVESIEIHPFYNPIYNQNLEKYSIEHDIAVLKLGSSLRWNRPIHLKDLPNLSQIPDDIQCEILRWTHPSSGETASRILTKSLVTVLNSERNEELGFHLGVNHFLAKGLYALPFASNKDIGNPIILAQQVIGLLIAINVDVMGSTDPVICLKIFPYRNFIEEVINRI